MNVLSAMLQFHLLPSFLLNFVLGLADKHQSFLEPASLSPNPLQDVLEHHPASYAPGLDCPYAPTGPIETTACDYESLESVNNELFLNMDQLVKTPFFKYFQVDLYRECPFWQENGFCMHRACGITSVNESDIPEKWRAAALSKIRKLSDEQVKALPGCYYRDSDFCFLDDHTEGDYIDLTANPEQFTGYSGPSARRVWSSIYDDNCFGIPDSSSDKSPMRQVTPMALGLALTPSQMDDPFGDCLEKQVYYRIISGMHASISMHICHDWMDQQTGRWGPNLQCFIDRVASHPERLRYIYFNTVLLLRAVSRIGPYLNAFDYCTGDHSEDEASLELVHKIVDIATTVGRFDETLLFRGEDAVILKEEFKARFRNVSRIMDCVGCDKCRLWGKVQTTGLGVAMKVLFELDENTLNPSTNPHLLQRTEVVALMNTLHRFSESLKAFDDFRGLWDREHGKPAEEEKEHEQESKMSRPTCSSKELSLFCTVDRAKDRLAGLLTMCRRSVYACTRFLSDLLKELQSMIQPKDGVPIPDL